MSRNEMLPVHLLVLCAWLLEAWGWQKNVLCWEQGREFMKRNSGRALWIGVLIGCVMGKGPAWAQFSVDMPPVQSGPSVPIQPSTEAPPSPSNQRSVPQEGKPPGRVVVPAAKKPVKHPRWGLIGGGIALTTLGYLGAVIPAAIAEERCKTGDWSTDLYAPCLSPAPSVEPLYIPVAGPFMRMGSSANSIEKLLYGLDAAVQIGGLAMVIIGSAWWETEKPLVERPNQQVKVRLLPAVSGSEAKLALVGTF